MNSFFLLLKIHMIFFAPPPRTKIYYFLHKKIHTEKNNTCAYKSK